MQQTYGIVLRTFFPQSHKLRVLDHVQGKIEGIVVSSKALEPLTHASLVTYRLEVKSGRTVFSDIKLYDSPLALARTDIQFLHHVLELVDFFILPESGASDIFSYLCHLYQNNLQNTLQKKIYLARFFVQVGMYHEHELLKDARFIRLLSVPVESMLNMDVDHIILEMLDSFLFQCVHNHPHKDKMKTIM